MKGNVMTRCLTLLTLSFLATTTLVEAGKNFDFMIDCKASEKLQAKSKKLIQSIEFAQDKSPELKKALEQKLNIITTRCVQKSLPELSDEEAGDWFEAQEIVSQEKSKFLEKRKAIFIEDLSKKEKTDTKKYIKKIQKKIHEIQQLNIFNEDTEEGEILTFADNMMYLRYEENQEEKEKKVSKFLQQEKKLHRILGEFEEMKEEALHDFQVMKQGSGALRRNVERALHSFPYDHQNSEILGNACRFLNSFDDEYHQNDKTYAAFQYRALKKNLDNALKEYDELKNNALSLTTAMLTGRYDGLIERL